MPTLKRAHIFATGAHPGQNAEGLQFGESDLDNIVSAFDALGQSGRVPIKFGHNDEQSLTDGQPALGWVSRVWREGSNLYADFQDMPTEVVAAVRKGLYKFASIELLKNATQGHTTYPYVLDAVALLGADPPAVKNLQDLQRLAASRAEQALSLSGGEPLRFKRSFEVPADDADDVAAVLEASRVDSAKIQADLELLRRELAELKPLAAQTVAFKADLAKVTAENTRLQAEAAEAAKKARTERIRMARSAATELLEAAVRNDQITPALRFSYSKLLRLEDDEAVLALQIGDVERLVGMNTTDARKVMMSRSAANRNPNDSGATDGGDGQERFPEMHSQALAKFARERNLDIFAAWPLYYREHPADGREFTAFAFDGTVP
jgi:hypothetical protein